MQNIINKQIAIIGAGPGGLTLARLLQNKGADIKVYERDAGSAARPQGATLDLHEGSGLKALQQAGLMDEFRASYRPGADALRITDHQGNILLDDAQDPHRHAGRPEIDRGPLQSILLNSLKQGTVEWDSQFVALLPKGDRWEAQFKNGSTILADLVIAADGANSKIRPYLTPIKSFYSGVTMVEGAINNTALACPNIHRLLNGGKIFALGQERSLIVSSKGDGGLVFYTGHKTAKHWGRECGIDFSDKAQVLDWFKTEFAGWGGLWHELFENASKAFVPRPQYCMPLDQTWPAQANLTMLGDAAHLMPPYAGEGVNMAMLDALELSEQLTSNDHPDTLTAIATYERQMRARTAEIGSITMASTTALHAVDAIGFMLSTVG